MDNQMWKFKKFLKRKQNFHYIPSSFDGRLEVAKVFSKLEKVKKFQFSLFSH